MHKIINDLRPIIVQAGQILKKFYNKKFVEIKYKSPGQIYTPADIESENFLKEKLSELIPNSSFLAEESGKSGKGDYKWIIDPLDGTTNFAQKIPYFCISVALAHKNKIVLGLIFDPLRDELFYAVKGKGAFFNENKLKLNIKKNLNESVFVFNFPVKNENYWKNLKVLRKHCFSMRLMGAAALDLAYIACGRFEGGYFSQLKLWDAAAGILLIQECGGQISSDDISKTDIKLVLATSTKDLYKKTMVIF